MDVSAVAPFSNVHCPTCDAQNRVKTEFGQYRLTRRLAEGGMSLVFVAMDNTLGREVALKILNEDYSADERRIAAFEEEARITASFTHPNVVRVFTTGRAFGRFFIAMELVPGGHFEHQIRERGKIPEIEMLPLAIQIAEGLEAARSAGLIHRDIKPGNILLDSHGNAKIVDFGLALVTKGGSATAEEIWATPYYVPPETIEGQEEDFRSDLYAFGATLYHALAGKPSCDEQSMATDVLRQAKRHVKALRFAAPDVSDDTCAIVDRAMAYDRQARFPSYEEMISQLTKALGRLKRGDAAPPLPAGKKRLLVKKGEWYAIAGAAVVLLGAVGGGLAWILRDEGPGARPVEPVASVAAADASDENGDAGTLIGQRYRDARSAVEKGEYETARSLFAGLRDDAAVQEPTRTWAAVEAVLVTYLDGRVLEARKEARAACGHISDGPYAKEKMGERLLAALGRLDDLEPAKPPGSAGAGDASWGLATMAGGLKNWEQGLTEMAAAEFFTPLAAAHFKGKDQWVKSYQKIAAGYLEDRKLLGDPVFAAIPGDVPACKAAVAKLDGLLKQVKTQGRARFNIRAFQLDLARQIKRLENPVPAAVPVAAPVAENPVPPPVPPGALPKFQELAKACRFTEAADYVKSLAGDPPGTSRDSLISISGSAASFLKFLEQEISTSPVSVQLRTREGDALSSVKVSSAGVLVGASAAGGIKDHGWDAIDPESVILLYRNLVRNRPADADLLQRHEWAIAYDWLCGDRTRATAAADRLGSDNPAFRQRWEAVASGLPK